MDKAFRKKSVKSNEGKIGWDFTLSNKDKIKNKVKYFSVMN